MSQSGQLHKQELLEISFSPNTKVDREAGVIRGVKVLGEKSANKRRYSEKAMSDAVRLYEGMVVNIDHPDKNEPSKERKMAERFGRLQGVRREDTGVFADLHYLRSHPLAEMIAEAAERMPDFGLSHNAVGDCRQTKDELIVESLELVRSVDIVGKPATNAGLFESLSEEGKHMGKQKTISLAEALKEKYPNTAEAVLLEMEGEAVPIDTTATVDTTSDPIEAVVEAMALEVLKVFRDPSISPKDTGKKVAEYAKIVEDLKNKLQGKKVEAAAAEDESGPEQTTESVDDSAVKTAVQVLQESVARLEKRLAVVDSLAEFGLTRSDIDASRRKLLESADGQEAMCDLIESWGPIQPKRGPRSSRPLTESINETKTEPVKDTADFVQRIRG